MRHHPEQLNAATEPTRPRQTGYHNRPNRKENMSNASSKDMTTTAQLAVGALLAVLAGIFLDGAWKIVPVVILLVLVFALRETVTTGVRKMRDSAG